MTEAAIIGAIRRGLKRGALPADQQAMLAGRLAAHPRHLIPARGQRDRAGRVDLFAFHVEREFGTVARLASPAEVPDAIATYLARQNLPAELVVSPHPDLQTIPFADKPLLKIRFGTALPADQACLTQAFAGIAETGTLMLPSGPTRPTSNNLLPDNALVMLRADDILGCYEEAFDRLREAGDMPRNVMLVTGPSRSADIEQTLELGAHGPRRLHVLIIDGQS
jgi:L-lactate dehydrogenase complex protein LldG